MIISNRLETEKRKDIVAHVDKSIFVEAGAGAGKTTLIVQRITNQIRMGFLRPEELVVITFTNKAAGELFERIQKSFELEEKNQSNSLEQRARFTYAIEHIEQMHISTIHSFCFSLLKERCFDAKLPLGVGLLENEESYNRQKRFLNKWIAAHNRFAIEEMKHALKVAGMKEFFYTQYLENMFIKICEKPEDVNFVSCTDVQLTQLEKDVDALTQKEAFLLKQLNDELVLIGKKGVEIYEKYTGLPFYPEMEGVKFKKFYEFLPDGFPKEGSKGVTYENNVKKLYTSGEVVELCKKGSNKSDKAMYEAINDEFLGWLEVAVRPVNLYKQWCAVVERLKELKTSFAYFVFLKYAIQARNEYRNQLDVAVLSNELLIQKAKALVWESQEARAYFNQKYKCIYVDEFQDTDHIQADLMWKLCSDENGMLKPGALFVVGDPKQAIYRFRGGEPAVYNQIKERMIADTDAEVYELDNNFRSNREVIGWVNDAFRDVINQSGITYRDMVCATADLPEETPVAGEEYKVLKGVFGLDTLQDVESSKSKDKATGEANFLAKWIQDMVEKQYQIYETKKTDAGSTRVLRPVHYGDFLILCWHTTQMDYYMNALKDLSIPVDLAGKTDIAQSSVLKRYVALYRFLLQPYDGKSRQGAKQVVRREKLHENHNVAEQRLQELLEDAKEMNCYGKAQYLLQHMEYMLPWEMEISKEDMYTLQARLHQMVESVLAVAKDEPEHILRTFENYILNKLEQELMLEENHKAVRFMNLHKAKGLEGNITILANRRGLKEYTPEYTASEPNANNQYDYYGCISDEYSSLDAYGYDANTKAVLLEANAQEEAEGIRLEYVAATRAKEVLVVTKEFGNNAPFSRYLIPEEMLYFVEQEEEDETDSLTGTVVIQGGKSAYETATEEMRKAGSISLSPSDLENHVRKMEEISEQQEVKIERRPKGNIFGTTMHRSFELLINKEGDIATCIAQAIIENANDLLAEGMRRYLEEGEERELYLHAVKEFLQQALERFTLDEAMRKLLAEAKEIYTELPFTYYTSPQQEPELFKAIAPHLEKNEIAIDDNQLVCIDGTADLVVVDAAGQIHIIDFKSDTNREESVEKFESQLYAKYEGQLLLYKYAMARIFGVELSSISTELYHLYK